MLFISIFLDFNESSMMFNPFVYVLSLIVVLTYYPYVIFVCGFIIWHIVSWVIKTKEIRGGLDIPIGIILLFGVGLSIYTFKSFFPPFLERLIDDFIVRMPLGYKIRPEMISIEYAIIVITNLWVAIYLQRVKSKRNTVLFYSLILVIPTFLSLDDTIFSYLTFILWVFPTRRAWPPIFAISLVFLIGAFPLIGEKISKSKKKYYNAATQSLLILSIVLFAFSMQNLNVGRWQRPVGNDRDGIEWILNNTDPGDLILNDRSYIGFYITSFRAQNVTNELFLVSEAFGEGPSNIDSRYALQSQNLNYIHDNPQDYDRVNELLATYQVKYIFIGSDSFYYDHWNPTEKMGIHLSDWTRRMDEFTTEEDYLAYFEDNPGLETVFTRGLTRVFKIRTP